MKQWSAGAKIVFTSTLLTLGPALLGFGQYFLIGYTSIFPSLDFIPLGRFFIVSSAIEYIIGYFMGDAYIAEYRHRTKQFNQPLPPHEQQIVRVRRLPFLIAASIILIAGVVTSFTFSF